MDLALLFSVEAKSRDRPRLQPVERLPEMSESAQIASVQAGGTIGRRNSGRSHFVVVTEDESFMWSTFETLGSDSELRVTGCSSIRETTEICARYRPRAIVVDLALLGEEPAALASLASLVPVETHVIGLTTQPVSDFSSRASGRLTFLRKPVEPDELAFFLALESIGRSSVP
jgi:hypothetical protein